MLAVFADLQMGEQFLHLIFNGSFKKEQHGVSYEGGNHIISPIQASDLSHQYILDLLSSVGCNSVEVVRYRVPGLTMVDGLRAISDEFDVRSLITHFNVCDTIELYVQHPSGGGSVGESSRQGSNAMEQEMDSEEDDDYIEGLTSEEESDEELMEARRALKLAKQRAVIKSNNPLSFVMMTLITSPMMSKMMKQVMKAITVKEGRWMTLKY